MQVLQSNKWTFSLASLVMFLAIGLVFAPISVMADETEVDVGGEKVKQNPAHPKPTLSVPDALPRGELENTAANSVIDVSTMADIQMLRPATAGFLKIRIASDQTVNLTDFAATDFTITGYNADGFAVAAVTADGTTVTHVDTTNPDGKNFVASIPDTALGTNLADIVDLYVVLNKGAITNNDPAIHPLWRVHPTSKVSNTLKITLVDDPADSDPTVISVTRVPNVTTPVSETFTVEVVLSEMPDGTVGPGSFTITNGTIDKVEPGLPTDSTRATGFDGKSYPYYLTVTPNFRLEKGKQHEVTIKVNDFMDTVQPVANEYTAGLDPNYEIVIALGALLGPAPGFTHPTGVAAQKALPAVTVKAGGYLVLQNKDGEAGHAGIVKPAATDQYVLTEKFNWWEGINAHASDLESFFRNGGTIQIIGGKAVTTSLIISEIMWGSHNGDVKNQWIELHNPGTADLVIAANEWFLGIYGPAGRSAADLDADVNFKVVDEMSNSPGGVYWPVTGKGQSARTQNTPGDPNEDAVSMYRVIIDGVAQDGTLASSWMQSALPNANINITGRIGTPGAASPPGLAPTPPPTPLPTPVPVTPVAGVSDITISEIMYSTGRGNLNLPQWIELHNVSASEVSLEGWNVEVENDGADDLTITLGATTAKADQAVLLVSKNGRNSGMGDEEGDLRRVVDLEALGVEGTLLSSTGFTITLSPPPDAGTSVRMDGDVAGGMDWDLPMMDGDRSSLIRETNADGTYKDGSIQMSWHPTSSTGRYATYYGHPSDMGTPGYVMGGPLPVELSMFYPTRDKLTGQVVITWETQSELNNAGFFVKRSEARNGKFVVINPTMIAGAGTTAEKQSYTYTDTTAKPNVVYYYQIEDVSLDGQRQTLTLGTRLRGHIGAAGKATTTWGELKAQE